MKIEDEVINRIKESCSIEEIISRYVALKRSGSRAMGLCPFHSEKTPSFTVFNDTQSFYCFGCGAGGDVITFIMRAEGLDYIDAIKFLADSCGIQINQNSEAEKAMKLRSRYLEINKEAARFFHEMLISESGKAGMDYLKRRGLKDSTIIKFGLGYAPNSWDSLIKHMNSKGYSNEELYKLFLVGKGSKSYFDMFRNRIMFPIIDITGKVIAFGGRRIVDTDSRKYINSSDTPVYKKGQTIFALNFAKKSEKLILTEGFLDTISLHEAGFTGAVATCGTAITGEQSRLLARYFDEVTIAYDSDDAGRTATAKAIELFKPTGISIKVLDYHGAKDPDEFIRKNGTKAFADLLYGSGNYIDYRLNLLKNKYDLKTSDGKVKYIGSAIEIVAEEYSSLKREVYISKISEDTEVEKKTLISEVDKIIKKRGYSGKREEFTVNSKRLFGIDDKANPEKKLYLKAAHAEEELICYLFSNYSNYVKIKDLIKSEDFVTGFNRRIFDRIVNVIIDCKEPALSDFNSDFNQSEIGAVTRITMESGKKSYTDDDVNKLISIIKEEKRKKDGNIENMDSEQLKDFIEQLKSQKA